MNYYNPYYMMAPLTTARPGLFGLLSKSTSGLSLSSIINGTQKTLNIVNQAIPLVKQVTPVMKNAKTMFKVMNEFKKVETKPNTNQKQEEKQEEIKQYTNAPTFFA